MRKLVLLAAVALAIVAASASAAQARGYTCIYKVNAGGYRIYTVIDGADNTLTFCRSLGGGMGGQRVSRALGPVYCAWQSETSDLRVSVRAPERVTGRTFCASMVTKVGHGDGFYRIR